MADYSLTVLEQVVDGSDVAEGKNTLAGSSRVGVNEEVATAETDKEITFALDVSATKLFYLESSQDVLFETNNGVTPGNSIALKAGKPYVWYTGKYNAFLLTVDVTAIFITNASGETATITIRALTDATP